MSFIGGERGGGEDEERRRTIRGQKEAETVRPIHCAGNDWPLAKVRKSISDWEKKLCWHLALSKPPGSAPAIHVRTNQPTASVVTSSHKVERGENLWCFITGAELLTGRAPHLRVSSQVPVQLSYEHSRRRHSQAPHRPCIPCKGVSFNTKRISHSAISTSTVR